MVFPALKRSPRDRVPATDWLLAVVGALAAAYISIFYRDLSQRPGLPTTMDLVSAGIGMVLLLEATRRALGPALTLTAQIGSTACREGVDQYVEPQVGRVTLTKK